MSQLRLFPTTLLIPPALISPPPPLSSHYPSCPLLQSTTGLALLRVLLLLLPHYLSHGQWRLWRRRRGKEACGSRRYLHQDLPNGPTSFPAQGTYHALTVVVVVVGVVVVIVGGRSHAVVSDEW